MKRRIPNPEPAMSETVAPDYWERLAEHQRSVLFSPEQRDILTARQAESASAQEDLPALTGDQAGELLLSELMGAL